MMRSFLLLAALVLSGCAQNPVFRHSQAPLPIAYVDLQRYSGLWHEQARLPNAFERGCQRAMAEYGRRADGLISVRNTCTEANGAHRVAEGRARTAGEAGEGKLEVSFFGPFWAKYWVLERADDYAWSIVGEPEGRYLWLLTRAPTISPQDRAIFEARIRALGYRPEDMEWAPPPHAT
jgi:apolipoprotein D and lipocalin family protein